MASILARLLGDSDLSRTHNRTCQPVAVDREHTQLVRGALHDGLLHAHYWMRTQQIIYLRDPSTYLEVGYWIAHHGSLPVPQSCWMHLPMHTSAA